MNNQDNEPVVDNKGLPFGLTPSEWGGTIFIIGVVIWVLFH